MFMQQVHATFSCSEGMQREHAAWTCSMDTAGKCSMVRRHKNEAWAYSINMQHGYALWTCSMDMGIEHGHGYAAWNWTCSMDMGML
jgi:hypothetical protein